MTDPRESLGRLVREVWVQWASEQPDPKPSWLMPWVALDDGQREVDMRIGAAVAASQRERIARLADIWEATYPVECHPSWCAGNGKHRTHHLPLSQMIRELGDESAPCETVHELRAAMGEPLPDLPAKESDHA